MNKKLTIGLFGFGVVGEGIYRVLSDSPTLKATIKKICIKHPDKKRSIGPENFTTSAADLLSDEEINCIVELIDDPQEAFQIVCTAMRKGKSVVSANKAMIAANLAELLKMQKKYKVSFLYEAAVCGSIPVIRNLEEYYDNDLLKGICGIVNGFTNYILTQVMKGGLDYEAALLQAQQLGFAESDPSLDVEGFDAASKLVILLLHGFGQVSCPGEILRRGINQLHSQDVEVASEKGYRIKLIAQLRKLSDGKLAALVLPQFVNAESQLYNVSNEFNGVVIESKLEDKQFLYGKGAGRFPTASAVLSDIAALRYDYRYEYRKLSKARDLKLSTEYYLKVYVSCNAWTELNKWDFEWVEESHSTQERQYLVGIISYEKLAAASWFSDKQVSVILMPDGLIEKETVLKKSIQKISLQLAGVV